MGWVVFLLWMHLGKGRRIGLGVKEMGGGRERNML